VLAALQAVHLAAGERRSLRIALVAPTGKAAARLQESVASSAAGFPERYRAGLAELSGSTVHRLLGFQPSNHSRFRHDAGNRLPHDVIVMDESSMADLSLTAGLLAAVKPGARMIFVGDADQLASVDAGAVLADLVAGYGRLAPEAVCRLLVSHRYGSGIGVLADAIRAGDTDRVVGALEQGEGITWIRAADPRDALRPRILGHAKRIRALARAGRADEAVAALGEHRLLCARRTGPTGVTHWNRQVQQWLTEETGDPLWEPFYPGRPLLVTRNDYATGLYNGDSGVVIQDPEGRPVAHLAVAGGSVQVATSRLAEIQTMYAMTVHKSQGSEADSVTVLLPDRESPLLTRELFYTAVTRARDELTVVGDEATIRAAVATRAKRATGLQQRLLG
jgi:exodeoxyribonuclease V alpha subunit